MSDIQVNIIPIMLALCLMLSGTYYAQNYASIIGGCLVSIIVSSRLVQIVFTGSSHGRYKGLLSMNIIFMRVSFYFLLSLFLSFSLHTFSWACGSLYEPRKFSLFVHSLVCPITHSFLDGFQPNLV